VARFLLAAREVDPALRFAANCRFDSDVEAALEELGWAVGEYDRDAQPEAVEAEEGSTMGWGARRALGDADRTPAAVIDRGAMGKEPITKLIAEDHLTLADRALALLDALEG
jgi:hydroxymethylpyrimidine/phosphomethylpyrimidine kinase